MFAGGAGLGVKIRYVSKSMLYAMMCNDYPLDWLHFDIVIQAPTQISGCRSALLDDFFKFQNSDMKHTNEC